MLYGEFLQLAAYGELAAFQISDGRMSKWHFIERFIIYFMEYRMIIGFYHIHKYMTFDMDMF